MNSFPIQAALQLKLANVYDWNKYVGYLQNEQEIKWALRMYIRQGRRSPRHSWFIWNIMVEEMKARALLSFYKWDTNSWAEATDLCSLHGTYVHTAASQLHHHPRIRPANPKERDSFKQ